MISLKIVKNLIRKRKGSTLAEMLISLVLIGIVFTIAMGTLVADHNRNQTVIRLEKAYSVFEQAIRTAVSRDGSVHNWIVEDGLSEINSYMFFENYLKSTLLLLRDCKNSTEGQCNYTFKELDGTEKALNSTWTRFFLNDGTFVALQTNGTPNYKVVYFYIDTNGKKRLNVVARDIFLYELWIQNDENPDYVGKFLPMGHQYSRDEIISESNMNNCNRYTNGNFCAALIMKDSWQLKKGYPWAQARYVVQ